MACFIRSAPPAHERALQVPHPVCADHAYAGILPRMKVPRYFSHFQGLSCSARVRPVVE